MEARITSIEIIPFEIELIEPFVISVGARTHANNTLIIIHSDQGVSGTGECSLNRTVLGDTQTGCVAVAKILATGLIGKNPLHIKELVETMSIIKKGNTTIKSAFDIALYDLASKLCGLPLYQFLGASNNRKIQTDMTIGLLSEEKVAEKARKYVDMGFPFLKIKLGERPSENDIGRIKAIRNEVGFDIPLRVDANQGWNYIEASKALNKLIDYNIQHCEEPIPYWNKTDQIRLSKESVIPIMADESAFDHHEVNQVLTMRAATMINIKLGKSGGICNAMKIGAITEAADVECQVGCFSETRLGITALLHFSYAWNNIQHFDMDSPLMLSEDPVIGGFQYLDDWSLNVPDTPGHGAEIDPDFLKSFDKITIK